MSEILSFVSQVLSAFVDIMVVAAIFRLFSIAKDVKGIKDEIARGNYARMKDHKDLMSRIS